MCFQHYAQATYVDDSLDNIRHLLVEEILGSLRYADTRYANMN